MCVIQAADRTFEGPIDSLYSLHAAEFPTRAPLWIQKPGKAGIEIETNLEILSGINKTSLVGTCIHVGATLRSRSASSCRYSLA
jgi:hypothetical protein